jgi:hypothetical protein
LINQFKNFISQKNWILILFAFSAILATLLSLLPGWQSKAELDIDTHYNNYQIYVKSFDHLREHKDLYIFYPSEYRDLYKYTPSFAVFFSVFSFLPVWLGLALWNLLNALILFAAVYFLPGWSRSSKGLFCILVLIELITSMQNEQSNGLIAGLLIYAFGYFERKQIAMACFCIVLSAFIKIFGVLALLLCLFYPRKWKMAAYTILWSCIFLILPLIFISMTEYINVFSSYQNMLRNDHGQSYGESVMAWLNSWSGLEINKWIVVLSGLLILLLPYLRLNKFADYSYRILNLASLLIWIIIFNHKAESPGFIIAMCGVAIWFINSKKNNLDIVLLSFVIIFTVLSPTDLFPRSLLEPYVKAYHLKVFPCILVWIKIIYELITFDNSETKNPSPLQREIPGSALG